MRASRARRSCPTADLRLRASSPTSGAVSASRSDPRPPRSRSAIPSIDDELRDGRPTIFPPAAGTRAAAVLVGLVAHPGEVSVLLTERAAGLRVHAGQIAFPGGKIEANDATPAAAALREARGGDRPFARRSSNRSAISILTSPAPAFASSPSSRASSRAFRCASCRRGRRRLRGAVRLSDGRRQSHASTSAHSVGGGCASMRCPMATAISGAPPPAFCASSTKGFIPDVARHSRARASVRLSLRRLCDLSRAAPQISVRSRALEPQRRLDAGARRPRHRRRRRVRLRPLRERAPGAYVPAHVENGQIVPGRIQ